MKDTLESHGIFLTLPKQLYDWLFDQTMHTPGAQNVQDVIRIKLDAERLKTCPKEA